MKMTQNITDGLVLARRNLEHVRQIPEKLIDVTLQPLMFVLLFAYVFGNVIHVPGGSYREYLMGGIFIQTLAFGLAGPATSLATDLTEGFVDRFRSLPSSRAAYLIGHFMAEMAASTLAIAVLTVSGLIVGWRIESDVPHALAGFGLLFAFSATMLWVGTLLGLTARSADSVMGIAFLVVFPLTFLAGAFVPIDGLPPVLATFAQWNPVSCLAEAVRTLWGNPVALPDGASWALLHPVLSSFAWCGALLAITVPLSLRRFKARTTD